MDIYSLTKKKRPSQLTIAQPSSQTDSSLENTTPTKLTSDPTSEEVTGPPTRDHWKVNVKK